VILTAADESWSDRLYYTAHTSDQTVGRYPDGSNQAYLMNVPTIAKANLFSSYAVSVEQPDITGICDRMAQQEQDASKSLFNLKGQSIKEPLAPGIYIRNGRKIIVK
jgi:hypothetical protein